MANVMQELAARFKKLAVGAAVAERKRKAIAALEKKLATEKTALAQLEEPAVKLLALLDQATAPAAKPSVKKNGGKRA
jgi:hypothetical protein